MSNTILTPTQITRESLRILHQKLNFIGTIDRQYDDRFAQSGAKIGDTLQIRLPNQFVVRTGKDLDAQDITERKVDLTVSTQKGVDMLFSTKELTLDIQDFSDRFIEPAMARLAAEMESDAMSMYKDVWNEISDVGAVVTLDDILDSAQLLTDSLTPKGKQRTLNLNTQDNRDLVDELKGLFNPQANIGKNYREGMVANEFVGFNRVFENTLWPTHTTGTDDGTGDYLINQTSFTAGLSSLTIDTGTGTWKQGDIFTIDNVYDVHPETKTTRASLKRFVVTADVAASATSISFAPAIYWSGALQNVNASPANNAPLRKRESDESTVIGASADYKISMGYHRDAFAFVTADMEMPEGVHFASRQRYDNMSMRIVRQYDINSDTIPCRIDVLYGYKAVRPELACRIGMN